MEGKMSKPNMSSLPTKEDRGRFMFTQIEVKGPDVVITFRCGSPYEATVFYDDMTSRMESGETMMLGGAIMEKNN
jgi:hypothetical protein